MPEKEKQIVGSIGLHINNGGVTISVIDEGCGPTIEIHSNAFGNIDHSFKILTDKESLKRLEKMFADAQNFQFSKDYCHKAS